MKRIIYCIFQLILPITTLALCEQNIESGKVRVIIKPDKYTILVNEPLYITIVTKNEQKEDAIFSADFSQRLSYTVSYEGEPFTYVNTPAEILYSPETTKIAPKSEYAWPTKVLFYYTDDKNNIKCIFSKPGKYRIQADLRTPMDYLSFQFDISTITVKKPDSSEEEAQKLIIDPKSAKQIRRPTTSEGGIDLLEQLVEKYPKSVYADYARYSLGQYYFFITFRSLEQKEEFDLPLKKTLYYFLSIPETYPELRVRALYNVCFFYFLSSTKRLATECASVDEIVAELDKHSELIKNIGYQDKINKMKEEFRLIKEKELMYAPK